MLNNQWNYGLYLKEFLNNGIPVLIYNGDKDFICNWRGAESWTQALVWDHQAEFNQETFKKWSSSNTNETQITGGEVKSFNNFTFFRIYDAGHMVPRDQPKAAFKMINEFITNGKLITIE